LVSLSTTLMATTRLHRGLVALSASAVAAVYLAGYLRTQSADASIGAAAEPVPTAQSVQVAQVAPPAVVRVQPTTVTAPAPTAILAPARTAPTTAPPATPAPAAATQGAYKDG